MKNLLSNWLVIILVVFALAVLVQAQQPPQTPFEETSIAFGINPITIPGGKTTLAAAESDILWRVTKYNHVGPTTLIGTGGLTFVGGRYQRVFPSVSNWIQQHTNFNGAQFEAGLTASLGAVRGSNTPAGGYWGERAGGFINYNINGAWSMGADVEWNNFPGWQHSVPSIAFGPLFHF